MTGSKADIVAQLQKEILLMEGFKPCPKSTAIDLKLGPLISAFPNKTFPLGAIHEFISSSPEDSAASSGFMAGLLSPILRSSGTMVWISSSRTLFPAALKHFGIEPERIIFLDSKKEKESLWAMEEALKCPALSAVVGEIPDISFIASRRLQLAIEQSQVTGFLLRRNPRQLNTTASVARWKITSLPSVSENDLPGIQFPQWNVQLLKIRNGRPNNWQLSWANESFKSIPKPIKTIKEWHTNTG